MKPRKVLAVIIALLMLTSIVLSCKKDDKPADQGSQSSAPADQSPAVSSGSASPREIAQAAIAHADLINSEIRKGVTSSKDTLTFAAIRDPGNLEFGNLLEFTLYPFGTMTLEYFMRYDFSTGKYFSPVCTYEADADFKGATFHITPNIMMNDGNLFTVEDVLISIQAFRDHSPMSWHMEFVDTANATIIDQYTLHLPFTTVNGVWESAFQMFTVISGEAYNAVGGDLSFYMAPVGPMPYNLTEHIPGESMTLTAFENYYRGEPPIKYVTMKVISDRTAAFMALQNGDIDLLWNISADQVKTVHASSNMKQAMMGENMIAYVGMNSGNAALSDFRVRQAISLAINRQDIIDGAYDGLAFAATSILTRETLGYNPAWDSNSTLPAQDIAKAKELMADAGYGGGLTLRLLAESTINFQLVTEQLALQLGEIGITLQPELTDYATMGAKLFSDDVSGYDLYLQLCQVSDDGVSTLDNPQLFRATHPELSSDGSNAGWSAIWDKIRATPVGSEREAIYQEANAYFIEKGQYWVPLLVSQTYVAMNPDLTGVRRNGFLFYFEDAYFK